MAAVFKAKYEEHDSKLSCEFKKWYQTRTFVDVTVHAGGQCIEAHKLVLAANSPFFNGIFQDSKRENSQLFFTDVPYQSMKSLIEYMYSGELVVEREFLPACLQLADSLKVRGISGLNYDEIITEPVPVSAKMQNLISNLMLQMSPPVERKKKQKKKLIGKSVKKSKEIANRNTISRLIFKKNKISGGYRIKKVHRKVRKISEGDKCGGAINMLDDQRNSATIRQKHKRREITDFSDQLKKLKKIKAPKLERSNSIVDRSEEIQYTDQYKQLPNENENIGIYQVPHSETFFSGEIDNSNAENIMPCVQSPPDSQCEQNIPQTVMYYENYDNGCYKTSPFYESPPKAYNFQQSQKSLCEERILPKKSNAYKKMIPSHENYKNEKSPIIDKPSPIRNFNNQFGELYNENNLGYDYNYLMKNSISEFSAEEYQKPSLQNDSHLHVPMIEMRSLSNCDGHVNGCDVKSSQNHDKKPRADAIRRGVMKQKRVTLCPMPENYWKDGKLYFRCTLCLRIYTHKSNYRRHYMVFHKRCEEAVFKCPLCDKKFTRSDNRAHHIRRIHKVDNTAMVFSEKKTSFICPLCQKSFTRNYNRTLHIKVVHGVTDTAAVLTNML